MKTQTQTLERRSERTNKQKTNKQTTQNNEEKARFMTECAPKLNI
jgi:hypothetical protein